LPNRFADGAAPVAKALREDPRPKQQKVADVAMNFPLPVEGVRPQPYVRFLEHFGEAVNRAANRIPKRVKALIFHERHEQSGQVDLDVFELPKAQALVQRPVDGLVKVLPQRVLRIELQHGDGFSSVGLSALFE
jgi:hypothetical protein